jgi:thiol-disulfide isomerase/thioredoxin
MMMLRTCLSTIACTLALTCLDAVAGASEGEQAPGFDLPAMDGSGNVDLAAYRGRIVYVDFWASWCGPCRQSLPLYEALRLDFPTERFEILAINLDEYREDAESFLADHPVSYPVLVDPSGESAARWGIRAMPSSYLIDESGVIARTYAGFEPTHIDTIRHDIQNLID